jgi:hypothetical protein
MQKAQEKADALKRMMKKSKGETLATENVSVFGATLQRAVQLSRINPNIELPAIVQQSILYLNAKGLKEEGIYRIPGSTTQVNTLKAQYNSGQRVNLDEILEPSTVAGTLKLYFRELPEPLLTRDLSNEFLKALEIGNDSERIAAMKGLLNRLPLANQACLNWMINHLIMVSEYSDFNKMTVPNLGVVFSPCLDIPPLLFKTFMQDYKQLFPNPFESMSSSPTSSSTSVTTSTNSNPNTSSTSVTLSSVTTNSSLYTNLHSLSSPQPQTQSQNQPQTKTQIQSPATEAPPPKPARTTSIKQEAPEPPTSQQKEVSYLDSWDDLENSINDSVLPPSKPASSAPVSIPTPTVSVTPANTPANTPVASNNFPPRPLRSVNTPANTPAAPSANTLPKPAEPEFIVNPEAQFNELDLILNSINSEDLDAF